MKSLRFRFNFAVQPYQAPYLERARRLSLPIALCALQLFGLIPFQLYLANAGEFSSEPAAIFLSLLIPMLASAFILCFIFAFVPERWHRMVCALFAGLAACLYLQSEVLLWRLGPFDGKEIDWSSFRYEARLDYTCWITCLVLLPVALARSVKPMRALLMIVLVMQLFGALWAASAHAGSARMKEGAKEHRSLYRLSAKKNVIILVLDTFGSPAFRHVLKREPGYASIFEGFTWFKDTIGAFPTTLPSIPAILSGKHYDNTVSIQTFLGETLSRQSLPHALAEAGFDVDLVTLPFFCAYAGGLPCFSLSDALRGDARRVAREETAKLLDLALFRSLPGQLKDWTHNGGAWRLQQLMLERKGPPEQVHSIEFIESFRRRAVVDNGPPSFKFLHLMLPHSPLGFDAECDYSESRRKEKVSNFDLQSKCALRVVDQFLETLKRLGVFDQSLVVVTADHGVRLKYFSPNAGKPMFAGLPLLLVKPLAAPAAPLATSDVPATIADLPASVASALSLGVSFDGRSIFDLSSSEERERHFHYYEWTHDNWGKPQLPPFEEYLVHGNSWEKSSWQSVQVLMSPERGAAGNLKP